MDWTRIAEIVTAIIMAEFALTILRRIGTAFHVAVPGQEL